MTPDPIGLDGGINLYAYVGGDPVNAVDPEGLFPSKWPSANPCDGYKECMGSKCCRDGELIDDPYPPKAMVVCNRFMSDYSYSPASMCVANCLIDEEKSIQNSYKNCEDRNAERLEAHVRCYSSCAFFPHRGLPEGGWKIGLFTLLPDYFRSLF